MGKSSQVAETEILHHVRLLSIIVGVFPIETSIFKIWEVEAPHGQVTKPECRSAPWSGYLYTYIKRHTRGPLLM